MTISGYADKPTITIMNAVALAGSGSVSASCATNNARYALVEWEASTGDTITMDLFASADSEDTSNGYLYSNTTRQTVGPLASASPGRSMMIELGRVVGRLKVMITNGTANATTVTARVTLVF